MARQETVEQAAAKSSVYAEPRAVTDLEECYFYHISTEIPGYGLVEGPWDLRGGVDDYLGNVDLSGKRVLEVGTASGFPLLHDGGAGRRRRRVRPVGQAVVGRRARTRSTTTRRSSPIAAQHLRKLNNSWWLGHGAFESSAKVVYGTVYEIPEEIGRVQVATYGNVLRHFRDPFLALERQGCG